jgi:chemotaxis protein methyltransferase CheR
MSRLDELVQHLKSRKNPALERSIAEAMTINETSFFRDGRPFELLRNELLPALIESRRPLRRLRFWSAACSTGQEAYSLAMLLHEQFPTLTGWHIRIEGTDISAEVIERAQAGCYHRIEINRPAHCPLLRPLRRGLDNQAGDSQDVQFPPGQPLLIAAALQPQR